MTVLCQLLLFTEQGPLIRNRSPIIERCLLIHFDCRSKLMETVNSSILSQVNAQVCVTSFMNYVSHHQRLGTITHLVYIQSLLPSLVLSRCTQSLMFPPTSSVIKLKALRSKNIEPLIPIYFTYHQLPEPSLYLQAVRARTQAARQLSVIINVEYTSRTTARALLQAIFRAHQILQLQ